MNSGSEQSERISLPFSGASDNGELHLSNPGPKMQKPCLGWKTRCSVRFCLGPPGIVCSFGVRSIHRMIGQSGGMCTFLYPLK